MAEFRWTENRDALVITHGDRQPLVLVGDDLARFAEAAKESRFVRLSEINATWLERVLNEAHDIRAHGLVIEVMKRCEALAGEVDWAVSQLLEATAALREVDRG